MSAFDNFLVQQLFQEIQSFPDTGPNFERALQMLKDFLALHGDTLDITSKIDVHLNITDYELRLGIAGESTKNRLLVCFGELNEHRSQLVEEREIRLRLFDAMGNTLLRLGYAKEASDILRVSWIQKREFYGEKNQSTTATMSNLVNALFRNRNFMESMDICQQFLAWYPTITDLQQAINNGTISLDSVSLLLKTAAESLKMLNIPNSHTRIRDIYQLCLTLLATDPHQILNRLTIQHEYANYLYQYTNDRHLAQELLTDCYMQRTTLLGSEHPDTLSSYHHLARAHMACHEFNQAIPILQQVLEIRRRVLTNEHESTLNTIQYLAECYDSLHQSEPATTLWVECLQIRKVMYEQGRLRINEVLASYDGLTKHLYSCRMYTEALAFATESYQLAKEKLGEQDQITLYLQNQIQTKYSTFGRT
jgi:tetratricopeptide (TPR) repeat protein